MSRDTAVVIGGSMAGLLAARVLSEHFRRVVIVERGELPDAAAVRRSVPQSAHVHGLLAGGLHVMQDLFPDLAASLREEGACFGDIGDALEWYHFGVRKRRVKVGVEGVLVSRPLLEWQIRRRVLARPNMECLTGARAIALAVAPGPGSRRVTGVRVAPVAGGAERSLAADLVVDASGRGAAAPQLLAEIGIGPIPESQVKVGVGYATRVFRRRTTPPWEGFMAIPKPPQETRGAVLFAVERNQWICTLAGYLGDHPPTDETGYAAFARSLPCPEIHDTIQASEPLGPIVLHKFPASLRRHYERVRLPEGFVVVGDAASSFNPVYGQGMTAAAFEARALGEQLLEARPDLRGFSARFQRRVAKIVDVAWTLAVGEDLRYPQVAGPRPLHQRIVNRDVARVHRATAVDPRVMTAFLRVMHFLAPPSSLFAPAIFTRAIRYGGPAQKKLATVLAKSQAELG